MKQMLPNWIHKDFKWNGIRFANAEELMAFSGQNYPESLEFLSAWLGKEGRIIVKTSGSTGQPKEIELKREQMISSARATGKYFDLGSGSRALLCLPLQYIAGKMMLVRAMTLGWDLHSAIPVTEIDLLSEKIHDFAAMVPLQLSNHPGILEKTRTLLLGGGEVPGKLLGLVQGSPCQVFQSYGMTETISHVALRPLNEAAGKKESTGKTDDKPAYYEGLPGIRFSLDERDCLVIHAPGISDAKVVTNDLVELVSENSFRWLARYDNVINSGGVKLIPELIEEKLSGLIGSDFFAYGVDDEILGQRLVLVVEGSPLEEQEEGRVDLLTELKAYQQGNPKILANFEIPKAVYFIPEMLRTASGKIRRRATIHAILDKTS